ncbi:MAG: type I methionyl aminopeptidase [Christensenellaceae bacterium]|nr:type I methionyl aminopeptidase [Christensenellaceae bacterium]
MIILKSSREIELMRESGMVAYAAMEAVRKAVRPGVKTIELDQIVENEILKRGAKPSFKGYSGFPGSACISVNDMVVHGIPGKRVLREGDIVSIDLGAILHGYHSDMARTFAVGEISEEHAELIKVTEECFFRGMKQAVIGNRISDIGKAIQNHAEAHGYGVVRELVGHGVGRDLHEDPSVPNYAGRTRGPAIREGMTLAIEPMINLGTEKVIFAENDDWDVRTRDGKYSAHYENTIAVTANGPEILTMP